MVPVRIASLSVDAVSNQPVIVLRPTEDEPGEGRLVPIWIGHAEATAILLALQGMEPPRPMTHDLLKGVIDSMDVALARVEITRIQDGTFYAALVLRGEERTIAVDARPSDSIALAVRTHSPIFIAEEVIEAAGIPEPIDGGEDVNEEEELERFREFLDEVNPEDFQG